MRKPTAPRLHGVLDDSTGVACATVARMMSVPRNARPLFDSLAAGYGVLLPTAPSLLGFSHHRAARNLCLALTGITAVVAALTDWTAEARR
jgi:hypothetical protein